MTALGLVARQLGDIADVVMGQSPPGSSYNRDRRGVPLINGPTEFTDKNPVAIQWTTDPARYCISGDVLVCVRGSSTGRLNVADRPYAIGRGVAAVRARAGADQRFLGHLLESVMPVLLIAQTGSTFPSIDANAILRSAVLVPGRMEQRRIAEALDDADALIAGLERMIVKKEAVKQGMMQQLLTGRTRLPGFTDPWQTHRLGDVAEVLDNLRIPVSEAERAKRPGPYPYCGANGVVGNIDRYLIDDDVILLAEDGGNFDQWEQRPIAYRMTGKIWVNNHAHVIKGGIPTDTAFLFFALEHKDITAYIASATRSKLTRAQLDRIRLAIPATARERGAIAATMEVAAEDLKALRRRLDKARLVKEGMMQQLLTGRIRLPAEDAA